ncbi:Uncharacterised protein [Legionella beliardensis]|uniref:Xylose isomerase-like TIM barrel n=1 Tax=Legionella beliardensis TaxID=91822 RepID=A0A378I3I4_9GAMM|nr:metabolite traffic protein EboE [Legionella beliardensis]STX29728.1 Uncharacterised protein [Legionella beliardensis]
MEIDGQDALNLTYCSNIHPGEAWNEVFNNLKNYTLTIKKHLAPTKPFGLGVRLSCRAASELLTGNELTKFKDWLIDNQLYIMTFNGFPYGNFHHQQVKEQVYAPDWSTIARRDYSLKLVKILAQLTPENKESGFSTSPISYKPWLDTKGRRKVFKTACIFLSQIVAEMVRINEDQGKFIHVDIEPEPDCLIETIWEAMQFFEQWLIPYGVPHLATLLKISAEQAENYLRQHVQLCYDICHSSVEFEQPAEVFRQLAGAEIRIGKIQVSAALKCKFASNTHLKQQLIACLAQFIDPIYLHQVIAQNQGQIQHFNDLNDVLKQLDNLKFQELRTHFHVPIFLEHYDMLDSTQSDIKAALNLLQKNKATHQLEIETYTWDVLPPSLKQDVVSSIEREYKWVLNQFNSPTNHCRKNNPPIL